MKEFNLRGWISRFIMFSEARFYYGNYDFVDYLTLLKKDQPVLLCWIYWTFLVAVFKVVLLSALCFQLVYSVSVTIGLIVFAAFQGVNLFKYQGMLADLATTPYQSLSIAVGGLIGLILITFVAVAAIALLVGTVWVLVDKFLGDKLARLKTRIFLKLCGEVKPKY